MDISFLINIVSQVIPILFAITIHEVAHGWTANKLGDSTAKLSGRLTLNPIKHIDPVGTILIPGLLILVQSPFLFGWAKPVPVDSRNLHHPRRDMAIVAAAGPLSNFAMAWLWAMIYKTGLLIGDTSLASFLIKMGQTGILINLILMMLNLIPIPPLDGSRVLTSLVSLRTANLFHRIEPYGFFILVILLATGVLNTILQPMVQTLSLLIAQTMGLLP